MAMGRHWYISSWGGRCDDIRALGKAADSYKDVSSIRIRTLFCLPLYHQWLPKWFIGKESTWQCRRRRRHGFDPWVRKIPWRRKWQPTLVFLPGKSQGQRSLVGYSPWGCKESDTTEQTEHAHTYHQHLAHSRCSLNNCAMNEWITTVWKM